MSRSLLRSTHPLDGVFAASSHLAILRALRHAKEGMSGRALARAAGINPQTCVNAIRNLESLSLLERQGTDQSQLIRLNRDNYLVKELILPLLDGENNVWKKFTDALSAICLEAMSVTIFGSFARRENRVGSDLDFLVVVANEKDKDSLADRSAESHASLKNRFGYALSQILLTLQEAKTRLKKNDPLLKNILKEGIDIGPRRLSEVIS